MKRRAVEDWQMKTDYEEISHLVHLSLRVYTCERKDSEEEASSPPIHPPSWEETRTNG